MSEYLGKEWQIVWGVILLGLLVPCSFVLFMVYIFNLLGT